MCDLPAVNLRLRQAKEMYETWTVGDVDVAGVDYTKWPELVARPTGGQNLLAPETDEEKDYIMFVHGWNMAPWEKKLMLAPCSNGCGTKVTRGDSARSVGLHSGASKDSCLPFRSRIISTPVSNERGTRPPASRLCSRTVLQSSD
jgi:hypothetical protein